MILICLFYFLWCAGNFGDGLNFFQLYQARTAAAKTKSGLQDENGEAIEDILSLELSMDAFNVEAAILLRSPNLNINNLFSHF